MRAPPTVAYSSTSSDGRRTVGRSGTAVGVAIGSGTIVTAAVDVGATVVVVDVGAVNVVILGDALVVDGFS